MCCPANKIKTTLCWRAIFTALHDTDGGVPNGLQVRCCDWLVRRIVKVVPGGRLVPGWHPGDLMARSDQLSLPIHFYGRCIQVLPAAKHLIERCIIVGCCGWPASWSLMLTHYFLSPPAFSHTTAAFCQASFGLSGV